MQINHLATLANSSRGLSYNDPMSALDIKTAMDKIHGKVSREKLTTVCGRCGPLGVNVHPFVHLYLGSREHVSPLEVNKGANRGSSYRGTNFWGTNFNFRGSWVFKIELCSGTS
jgi:hypothetical protein